MKVPFLDLRVLDEEERQELLSAFDNVLSHGRIVLGPEVQAFEKRFAERCGKSFAVGVNSGTDALILALRAIGVTAGDEVITTPLSFVATANAITLNGAEPVFADIGDDLNLDPASIEPLITPKTKAILPVHYTGRLCNMEEINAIAKKHDLVVIEDCAQAIDASHQGRTAGSYGLLGCFSMNAMKVLASCGEAGVIVTNDETYYEHLTTLRYHGLVDREFCHQVSHNGRIDTLQAAILLKRLDRLDGIIAKRRDIAAYYDGRLKDVVTVPPERPGYKDTYYTYTIQTDRRDELGSFLADEGIETKIQHPLLMPQQPFYKTHDSNRFPNAKRLVQKILCIPANEKITNEQREYVADTIVRFF